MIFKDKSYLILLSVLYHHLEIDPSDELIYRLITEGDDIQANIGFSFAVLRIDIDKSKLEFTSKDKKNLQAIYRDIEIGFNKIDNIFQSCTPERRTALLFNYILSNREYFDQFGLWIMDQDNRDVLVKEIRESGKIRNLNDVEQIANMISYFNGRRTKYSGVKRDDLYSAIVDVIKDFVENDKGIYSWDDNERTQFENICRVIPAKRLRPIRSYLARKKETLMASELDSKVRFKIYLHDKRVWDVCQGMIECIESRQKQDKSKRHE